MPDESKPRNSYYPTHEPIPAGTMPEYSGSIPAGVPPLGVVPDLGSNATLLGYLVPCEGEKE